jgi:hypothetical protein
MSDRRQGGRLVTWRSLRGRDRRAAAAPPFVLRRERASHAPSTKIDTQDKTAKMEGASDAGHEDLDRQDAR